MKVGTIIYKNSKPYTVVEVYQHDWFAMKEQSIIAKIHELWLDWDKAIRYYRQSREAVYKWPWPTTCWTVVKVDTRLPAWNTVAPVEFFDWCSFLRRPLLVYKR